LTLGLFLSLGTSCAGEAPREPADLTLLTTGTVNGYIEPCGCVVGQIGGIDRIAGYIEDELDKNPEAFFVETGDLVAEKFAVDESVRKQAPLKAEAFFSVWGDLGCTAFALGENDLLMLGTEELKKLSARHAVPILCGNLVDESGEQVFENSIIIERGGKRIGIFSLLAPKIEQPIVTDAEIVDVAALVREEGLRIQNWRLRAKAIVDELLPKTDMILCASHLGFDLNKVLAEICPQIDLVFGGHFGSAKAERMVVGNTPVLISLVRGSRVDKVEWWWPDSNDYFVDQEQRALKGNGSLMDISENSDITMEVDVAMAEFIAIGKRELAHDPEVYKLLYEDKVALINAAERAEASQAAIPDVNRFSHLQMPMHLGLRRSETALVAVDHYHSELQQFWNNRSSSEDRPASVVYRSPEDCTKCHPSQVDFWKATRHSFALSTLETTGQEVDAECFYCHTVGYRLPGGFRRPGKHDGFENVQCAACHGPAGEHMSGGASYFNPDFLHGNGATTCTECHNKEHDPKFPEAAGRKIGMVACPPLEPVSERTKPMLLAAAQAADAFMLDKTPRWAELIRAYTNAGLSDKAMQVAEGWLADRPKSKEAHIAVGELLLGAGRLEESVRHFEFFARKSPSDVRGWDGLARSLMYTDPDRALEAAREAQSLQQSDPMRIKTLAEVLIAQGRMGAAEELLLGYVDTFPSYAAVIETFLARLAEERASTETR
ncbi:MAG: tetratricopeptide (TPR) repeat protein, partial [Planctomycetota bacterium]